eukprot:TRINITY_DN6364_c0_g2_i1.p2 TRINITY_DN6364_c0_g2~~TRINITY_DN6364_c0_g2_i1.p2  ORF type:complete len:207 (+),score=12.61 TRINITY_DN6364_c0_g2_i1:143-763(+)
MDARKLSNSETQRRKGADKLGASVAMGLLRRRRGQRRAQVVQIPGQSAASTTTGPMAGHRCQAHSRCYPFQSGACGRHALLDKLALLPFRRGLEKARGAELDAHGCRGGSHVDASAVTQLQDASATASADVCQCCLPGRGHDHVMVELGRGSARGTRRDPQLPEGRSRYMRVNEDKGELHTQPWVHGEALQIHCLPRALIAAAGAE